MRTISQRAIAMATTLLNGFEGEKLRPYPDIRGIWTIGCGCTCLADGSPVTAHTLPITPEEAQGLLRGVLSQIAPKLAEMVSIPLLDCQAAPLLSLQYNIGSTALRRSHLLMLLNQGDTLGAADDFLDWVFAKVHGREVKVPDLVERRTAERDVFLGNRSVPPAANPAPAPAPAKAPVDSTDALNAAEMGHLDQKTS